MDTFPTMKTHLPHSLLAVLALSFAASTQLGAANPAGAASEPTLLSSGEIALESVNAPRRVNGDSVTHGTPRIMVSMRLGSPTAVLPDGTWLYQGYKARRVSNDAGADSDREIIRSGTLIVRFADKKVASLSVADEPTIARLRQKPAKADDRARVASDR